MAKAINTRPAMQETQNQSPSWEDPWRREWQPTPVVLPGKFHGQRSWTGYSPWGHKELDVTKHAHKQYQKKYNKEKKL